MFGTRCFIDSNYKISVDNIWISPVFEVSKTTASSAGTGTYIPLSVGLPRRPVRPSADPWPLICAISPESKQVPQKRVSQFSSLQLKRLHNSISKFHNGFTHRMAAIWIGCFQRVDTQSCHS
jgi:hypothetical protein